MKTAISIPDDVFQDAERLARHSTDSVTALLDAVCTDREDEAELGFLQVAGVPLTSSQRRADALGNVLLASDVTGLPKDSVANVSQPVTLDRKVLSGLDVVLGREQRGTAEAAPRAAVDPKTDVPTSAAFSPTMVLLRSDAAAVMRPCRASLRVAR